MHVKELQKCKHVSIYSCDSISNNVLFQNVYEASLFANYVDQDENCLCSYIINIVRGEREGGRVR